jgi:hypothetical protein
MKPWFTNSSPSNGDARSRRGPDAAAQQYDMGALTRSPAGPMSRENTQAPGKWMPRPSSLNQQMPPGAPASPSDISTGASRPITGETPPDPSIGPEVAWPVLPISRFGRATGLSLKLRFLLALTLLSLAPAFLLVLLYQQANQTSLTQTGQQILLVTAQNSSHALTRELLRRQQQLAQMIQQPSIVDASQGLTSSIKTAEGLLNEAYLSTTDGIAWMVLDKNDQIVAAAPVDFENQALGSSMALQKPAALEDFVKAQRALPAPKSNQTTLAVATGQDSTVAGNVWIAMVVFTPSRSGAVLAVFSFSGIVDSYLSAFSSSSTSYAALLDAQGIVLGAVNNQQLEQQQGQPLSAGPLQNVFQTIQSSQGTGGAPIVYYDPTTREQEAATGVVISQLNWVCLVAASPQDIAPSPTGLLSPRNLPLIFLSIVVVTTLVATWVALPIVRPIRRATREILASTDDVRLLAEQAKQIAKDQRLGTDILKGAAKGLDLRRQAIGRDAGLIASAIISTVSRLTQMAQIINALPETFQAPLQPLAREIYQELRTSHHLAIGIANSLESDPVQKRLGTAMEGASEISQQFDQASQQLQQGASRLERAAEALQ